MEQAKLDKAAQQSNDYDSDNDDNTSGLEVEVENEYVKDDPARLLTREELTEYMINFAKSHNCTPDPRYENRYQFGTVGFPNVG